MTMFIRRTVCSRVRARTHERDVAHAGGRRAQAGGPVGAAVVARHGARALVPVPGPLAARGPPARGDLARPEVTAHLRPAHCWKAREMTGQYSAASSGVLRCLCNCHVPSVI